MKKMKGFLGLMLVASIMFVSCGKDDNRVEPPVVHQIKVENDNLTILEGESKTIKIVSGNGGYQVKSDNDNVTVAEKDNTITITGQKAGESIISVTDSKQKRIAIKVKVSGFVLSATEISIIVGKSGSIQILSGSEDYQATSEDVNIAIAEIVNNEVKITAENIGTTQIIVVDKKTNKKNFITAKIVNDLKMEKAELLVTNGEYEIINILGADNTNDNYEFEITTTPADVVSAEHKWFDAMLGHHLKVTGLKPGEATVTIKDKQTQQVTSFKATVNLSEFSIPNTMVNLSIGASTSINIKGNGEYEVNSADSSVATAVQNNGVLTITAQLKSR